jgi:hypothetical protein
MSNITFTKTHMIVTLDNGQTAKRGTLNNYKAAVVGTGKTGALVIISAHFDASRVGTGIEKATRRGYKDVQVVTFKEPVADAGWEAVSEAEQEAIISAECKAIREGRKVVRL